MADEEILWDDSCEDDMHRSIDVSHSLNALVRRVHLDSIERVEIDKVKFPAYRLKRIPVIDLTKDPKQSKITMFMTKRNK